MLGNETRRQYGRLPRSRKALSREISWGNIPRHTLRHCPLLLLSLHDRAENFRQLMLLPRQFTAVTWSTIRRDARDAWLLATLSSWAKQTHYLTILSSWA